jgi:methionine-rich copper-binding protein CopC
MSRHFPLAWLPSTLLIAVVCGLVIPPVVAAHAELVRATPAAGSTVTEPVSEVSAIYSEDLTGDSRLGVLNEAGVRIAVGRVYPGNKRRMVATLEQVALAGTFTVRSTAISTDGHIEKTDWTFTVVVHATPSPTPAGQSSAPATSEPSATTEATATPTGARTPAASPPPGSSTGSGTDVILPIIAGLAIITIGAGLLISRGHRGPSA